MANYSAKGIALMRELGRRGGVKSGETRRLNADTLRVAAFFAVSEMTRGRFTSVQIVEAMRPPDQSSGAHDTDWRCPHCHHFNSIKRRACAKCKAFSPANGRLTRAVLRERQTEHHTTALAGTD
jgi:hypothetical protein